MADLTPAEWERIQDLFHEALARPAGAARRAFVRDCTPEGAAIHRMLAAMLDQHEAANDLLDESGAALASLLPFAGVARAEISEEALEALGATPAPAAPRPDLEGQQVGAYRVVREVGRGGMGSVYLAERTDGAYRQQVALKVIRRGLDTEDVLRRFRTERQILATLTHPNIARLLDGGQLPDGRSYFIMEYVDGLPLTEYCDAHRLSLERRLALFLTVCDAVHFAHQNLVVHRDLKPQNILVTEAGELKLLDFGIAKLLDPEAAPFTAPLTRGELRLLTPEYAAPEQVRGEAVTTSTDVYSLGVLLFELVAGQRPYDLPSRLQREVERIICEEPPVAPSTRLLTSTADTAAIGAQRGVPVERLRRRLKEGLDDVALFALRKEPGRRYRSVQELANDLNRYRKGLPLEARPDHWAYRLRLFGRRHRLGVAAGVVVVLALALGFGTALWQARIAQAERRAAEAERDTAEEALMFMENLFNASNPFAPTGGLDTLRVHDLLAYGSRQVLESYGDQPTLQIRLLNTLGDVYGTLGRRDEARTMLEAALARLQTHDESALRASTYTRMCGLEALGGHYEAARPLCAEAYALAQRAGQPALRYDAAFEMSVLAYRLGVGDEAVTYGREAVALASSAAYHDADVVPQSRNLLALALSQRAEEGDYEEARQVILEALAAYRTTNGPDHLTVAETQNTLAILLSKMGRYEEAVATHEDVLRIRRLRLPPNHVHTAFSLLNIGATRLKQQRYEAAEVVVREAAAMLDATFEASEGHDHRGYTLLLLAKSLVGQGRAAEARPVAEEALRLQRVALPEDHEEVQQTLTVLAAIDSALAGPVAERDAVP